MMLLWACCMWVVASAVVALLPMRLQYAPGVALLVSAPMLILWLCVTTSFWLAIPALFALGSMYRNPLRYFWARARGFNPEVPK